MTIRDLHVVRPVVFPSEAYPPLSGDPYAVLAGTVALQRFQTVAPQRCEVHDGLRVVQIGETTRRLIREPLEPGNTMALKNIRLGVNGNGRSDCRWLKGTAPPSSERVTR